MQPLIKRSKEDEARKIKNYSTLKITPESIVQTYRSQKSRREPCVERSYIFTPARHRIPWYRKINLEFVIDAACIGLLGIITAYVVIWVVVPFVSMLARV